LKVADYIITIDPITENSSREDCIETMMDHFCYELPVLKQGVLYGTVQLDECVHSLEETIATLVDPGYTSVGAHTHLFDVLRIFNDTKANICSVLDENVKWVGIVTKTMVVEALGESLTANQVGAIIIVEMAAYQYSSSELARILEGEGAQLLGLWLTNLEKSGRIRASLKLNIQNAERIIKSLQRHGYETVASFGDNDYMENVESRFQSLMKYIDL
jgi:acetoin utilization protein AcuB